MLQELICQHIQHGTKNCILLSKPSYKIGKALDNDIVLLDADVLPYLASIERKDLGYAWVESSKTVGLQDELVASGYRFRIRNHRYRVLILVFLLILTCSLFFFRHSKEIKNDKAPVIQLPARGAYGNLDSNRPIRSIGFEFQTSSDRYPVLHYTPGNLNSDQELEIQVDGRSLGFAPASVGKWNVEQALYLPKESLSGPTHHLEFLFRGDASPWGVKDIYVEEFDERPASLTAEDFLKTAEKLWRERNVRPGNLVRAEKAAHDAVEMYRLKNEESSPLLGKISEQIKNEKRQMINDHTLLIQKYEQQGEGEKARKILQKLLNELVDPMDPDRARILDERRGK